MHAHPKLILLNGPDGVGKSTIARRYLDDHPLALAIEGDVIIAHMGQWLTHEDAARKLVFEIIKAMARTHLKSGQDVIVPYLLFDPTDADTLEQIADECQARFIEVALVAEREDSIRRFFARGTWGEPDSPPVTEADRPIVEDHYDRMRAALEKRPHMRRITSAEGQSDQTYRDVMATISVS